MKHISKHVAYNLRIVLLLILFLVPCENLFAADSTVNILSWWGYLNHPEMIKAAEKSCKTHISFDEYYTNNEFLRRWNENRRIYQIIIFSNTIYNVLRADFPVILKSKLWKQSKKYNPIIRKHYLGNNYPPNVVYYVHSLTGFLYNRQAITLSPADSIIEIFQKADQKFVIILDDPAEAMKLVRIGFHINKNTLLNFTHFKRLMQNSYVIIGNGFNQIYNDKDFAFAFTWSGEGLKKSNKDLKFLIHPQLSYISSDLLAQTKASKTVECVANFLTSEASLQSIVNDNFYFFSYSNTDNITNPEFKEIYEQFLRNLPKLHWIPSINANENDKINDTWNKIKLELLQKKRNK